MLARRGRSEVVAHTSALLSNFLPTAGSARAITEGPATPGSSGPAQSEFRGNPGCNEWRHLHHRSNHGPTSRRPNPDRFHTRFAEAASEKGDPFSDPRSKHASTPCNLLRLLGPDPFYHARAGFAAAAEVFAVGLLLGSAVEAYFCCSGVRFGFTFLSMGTETSFPLLTSARCPAFTEATVRFPFPST